MPNRASTVDARSDARGYSLAMHERFETREIVAMARMKGLA
jgi:hypothetical protein